MEIRFTQENLKKLIDSTVDLAAMVLVKQAFAKCERERVDAYAQPLLDHWLTLLEWEGGRIPCRRERVKKVSDLYMVPDTEKNEKLLAEFYEELDHEHVKHGWKGEKGHCPALVAENAARDAENELVCTWFKAMGIDWENVWQLEYHRKMLDLALGAIVSAKPEVFNRFKAA